MTEVPRSQGFDQPIHHLLFAVLASDSSWWQQNFHPLLQWHSSGSCFRNLPAKNNYIRCLVVWFIFFIHLYNFSFIYDHIYRLYRSYRLYSHWTCWFPVPVYPDPGRRIRFRKKEAPGAVASTCTSVMDFCLRRCIDRHMYYIYIFILYIVHIHTLYIYTYR